jgi:hypothetical protein
MMGRLMAALSAARLQANEAVLETVSATLATMATKKATVANMKKAVIIWRLRGVGVLSKAPL